MAWRRYGKSEAKVSSNGRNKKETIWSYIKIRIISYQASTEAKEKVKTAAKMIGIDPAQKNIWCATVHNNYIAMEVNEPRESK